MSDKLLFTIIAVIIIMFLIGQLVMLLWNWLMPYLFGLPKISVWMAWGLIALISLLFSGLRIFSHKGK